MDCLLAELSCNHHRNVPSESPVFSANDSKMDADTMGLGFGKYTKYSNYRVSKTNGNTMIILI